MTRKNVTKMNISKFLMRFSLPPEIILDRLLFAMIVFYRTWAKIDILWHKMARIKKLMWLNRFCYLKGTFFGVKILSIVPYFAKFCHFTPGTIPPWKIPPEKNKAFQNLRISFEFCILISEGERNFGTCVLCAAHSSLRCL